jgi:hypothetical protein
MEGRLFTILFIFKEFMKASPFRGGKFPPNFYI